MKKKLPTIRFSDNLNLLAVSFAIAFVAWIFAKAGRTQEATISVPVVAVPSDPRLDLQIVPPSVTVQLRYSDDIQAYVNSQNLHFEVDIADLRSNLGLNWLSKSLPLTEKNWVANIPRSRRVELLKIGTQSNTVEIRARWNAQPALVEADVVGQDQISEGLKLTVPVKVVPHEVHVAGTAQALDSAERDELTSKIKLLTEKISVAQRTQGGLESVPIKVPAGLEIVQPATTMAEVNLEIQEVATIREIRNVPLQFDALASDTITLSYREKGCTVTVYGPQSMLKNLAPDSIDVQLLRPAEELPGTTKDVPLEAHFSRSVPADVQNRLTIRSVEPKSIRIQYMQKATESPNSGGT
ncbi:MAG: hypothetical protein K1X53_10455 [Candidatus Sumerlaeaceae bacterium]|nr:hypothetical protein [Candidatus Sumerlaeaceae bacterium]